MYFCELKLLIIMAFDDPIQKNRNDVHLGRNVQRIREIIGMKQSALADNTDMSQQNISKLENSPFISEETLERLAKGLGVTPEFIKSFNDEKAVYNIQSNFTIHENGQNQYQPVFYTSDIAIQLIEKLLESEREKVALLQELLKEAKGKKEQKQYDN
jgi:transcriptional regulator with XRE-family HTH domain